MFEFCEKMRKKTIKKLLHENVLILVVWFMFFAFSSLNYFMARYQLLILPLLMIFAIVFFTICSNNFKHYWLYIVLTIPFLHNNYTFSTDNNMSYEITINNMQHSIQKLDSISQGKALRVFCNIT